MSDHLERAELLLDLHRPGDAEALIRAVLGEDPGSVDAQVLLARALLDQGRYDEALTAAQAGIAGSPDDEHGHLLSATALLNLGRRDEAVSAAGAAVAADPGSWTAHLAREFAVLAGGSRRDATAALADSATAVRLAPDEPDPHHLAGMCLRQLGRLRAAAQEFSEAVRLDPAHTGAVGELARTHLDRGRLGSAGRLVSSGLSAAPAEADLQHSHDALLLNGLCVALTLLVCGGSMAGAFIAYLAPLTRAGIVVATLAAAASTLWWVSRSLPQGLRAWPSLYRRGGRLVRLLIGSVVATATLATVVALLPAAAVTAALVVTAVIFGCLVAGAVAVFILGLLGVIPMSGPYRR